MTQSAILFYFQKEDRIQRLIRVYGEMAQKVIGGHMSHVKSYASEIEMAQFQNDSKSR